MSVLSWKGAVFSSSCVNTTLRVNWYYPSVTNNCHPRRSDLESDEDCDVAESSEHGRDLDSDLEDIFQDDGQFRSKGHRLERNVKENQNRDIQTNLDPNKYWSSDACGLTEIDTRLYGLESGHLSIIAHGFSTDPFSSIRVLVFLVSVEDISLDHVSRERQTVNQVTSRPSKRAILFGLSDDKSQPLLFQNQLVRNKNVQRLCGLPTSSFKLIPLRTFYLEEELNSHSLCNTKFISNYGFIHITSGSAELSLYFGALQKVDGSHVQRFDLSQGEGLPNRCKILLFDVFNCFERNSFVFMGILSEKNCDEPSSKSCVAQYFYPQCHLSKEYKSKDIQVKNFFPEDFCPIVLSFSMLNLAISRRSFQVKTSSVIIISTTGFAIRFRNGEMTHCVGLHTCIQNSTVLLHNDMIKIIDIDSKSNQKVAICVDKSCEIVDWSKKKVSSSYHNVSFISKHHIFQNGGSALLLLLYPQSGPSNRDTFCVKDMMPLIIDGTEVEEVEGRTSPSKDQTRGEAYEDIQDDSNVPPYVLESLTCQEKKCQAELEKTDQLVRNKEIFISNMQQLFSNGSSLKQGSDVRNMYLQPLVPLTQESVPKKRQEDLTTSSRNVPKFGQLWKRTVDSLLICGVEVTNTSKTCHLSQLNLAVLLMHSSTSSVESSSKVSNVVISSPSPVRKKICLQDQETTECCQKNLKSGESASITAFIDVVKMMGGKNIEVKVLLTYNLHNPLKYSLDGEMTQSVCCGSFSLSPNDIVCESFSLKPRLTGSNGDLLNEKDILALDCIQKSCVFEINSVMSSVLTFKSALKQSHLVTYIPQEEQYIVSADHPLRYCRIKWLNQSSKQEGRVKVYTRSHTDALLLVQFLYNLVPKDITIRLPDNHSKPSLSAVKSICQSLVDRVDKSITEVEKSISLMEIAEKRTTEKPNDAATNVQVENVTAISVDILADNSDEITETLPSSPTFQSSASRQGRMHQKKIIPSSSEDFVNLQLGIRKDNSESFMAKSKVLNTLPDSDVTAVIRKKHNDPSKFKNRVGKGGQAKGKGKLAIKK